MSKRSVRTGWVKLYVHPSEKKTRSTRLLDEPDCIKGSIFNGIDKLSDCTGMEEPERSITDCVESPNLK